MALSYFCLCKIAGNFNFIYQKIIFIIIVIFISVISYHFVEKKFRRDDFSLKYFTFFIFFALSLLILSSSYILFKNGNLKNYPNIITKYDYKTWEKLKLNGRICFESSRICEFNEHIPNKIFLIGDSIAGSLAFDLKNRLLNKNYNFNSATIGCWYLPDFNEFDDTVRYLNEINNECSFIRQNYIKNTILNTDKSIVILSGNLPQENSKHINNKINFEDGIIKSINDLINLGHYVFLVYPLPFLDYNPIEKLVNDDNLRNRIPIFSKNIDKYFIESKKEISILNRINHPNVIKIYPHKVFCDTFVKEKCVFNNENHLYFIDELHPSYEGSVLINKLIIKEIDKIYLKNH